MAARPNLDRPRAVLFDWDDTLVDNWGAIADALNGTLTTFGHEPWSMDEVRRRVRASLRDSFPSLFGERWREARALFYRSFTDNHLAALRVLPGAAEALEILRDEAIYLGVVSNKRGDLLRREAAHLGWQGHFGSLVGAGDADADKPAPDPVHMALRPGAIPAGAEVWVVGDTGVDMASARRAGCVAVLIGGADAGGGEFRAYPPHAEVPDLAALLDLARGR